MGFFKNKTFNLIYVHAAMQSIAMHGGEAFAFVYLLKAGISVPVVLLCIGAMFGTRLMFRKLVMPLVKLVGLQYALAISIVAEASTYPILSLVTDVGPMLVAYLALWAISSSMYWTTYHAYVALLGNNEHRGSQVSVMEFLNMAMGIGAPLAMGLLLTWFSPLVAFGAVGLVMAASAIPILMAPPLQVADDVVVPKETARQAMLLMFTDGLRSGAFHFTWMIAFFITLGSSYVAYGGTIAVAGLVGAVAGLFAGRAIDLGNGLRAAQIGFSVLAIAALARMFGYSLPWTAVAANIVAALAWPLYGTMFNARMYVLARQSPCPLRYHIIAEGGWDLGTATACFISAGMVAMGFSFFWPLAVSLVGCAIGYWVVAGTYKEVAATT
jgi:MFS transporter, DHA1 family, inner membrane transport protein